MRLLLLLGLLGSCASAPKVCELTPETYRISWPDDSQDKELWACMYEPGSDPKDKKLVCIYLRTLLESMAEDEAMPKPTEL